ncbi:hypothetical protein [Planomonospora venezuelensis]|uniref:Uncharacterized protein n=1 Tax=Planomonospora venezuelensis TaxID=1999 RepID=A0A841D4Q0_PLAVE|nr:hypothetical protein [Planomonospora venezuelensis]MBB5962436.1 hypothetical protein [Planomonospora venezuelensis]GIN00818.1 hypothetical protein Pve01_24760 [Planomonospora venezuelensis]
MVVRKNRRLANVIASGLVGAGVMLGLSGMAGASAPDHGTHRAGGGDPGPAPAQSAADAKAMKETRAYLAGVPDGPRIALQVLKSGKARELARVYRATLKYRDIDKALADGYSPGPNTMYCVEKPGVGGMGFHLGNHTYIDETARTGVYDLEHPHILVYTRTPSGRMELAVAEWGKIDEDQNLATDDDRPSMLGMPFEGPMLGHVPMTHGPGGWMPIHFDKHFWLYKYNPAGLAKPWNPRVTCPAGTTPPPHPDAGANAHASH